MSNPTRIAIHRANSGRLWRLMSDGAVERQSRDSRWQNRIVHESVPVEILSAAGRAGLEIKPGRPIGWARA